jgi:pyrroloquinoline quinone (PQQ) biosynthesis protein C
LATLAALLEESVNPSVRQLLQLQLFSRPDEFLPLATEVQILKEYEQYTSVYPTCVALALSAISSEAARIPLVKNLWEEHGEGNRLCGHRYLMHCWVQSVNSLLDARQDLRNAPLHSTTQACDMLISMSGENALFRFGVILGLEYTNSRQLESLLARLPASSGSQIDRRYVDLHLEADEGHAEELMEVTPHLIKSSIDMTQVLQGARHSIQADMVFWTGVDVLAMNLP